MLQVSKYSACLLTFILRHAVCVAALLNYPSYKRTICGALWSFNTLMTGDADLRLYITTVQDG